MANRNFDVPITFFVNAKLKKKLQQAAKREKVSASALLRALIETL